MIVSNISEKKISSEEYRITLEARRPKFLEWKHDHEEYEGRVDHKIDVAEFFITAEMAGYVNVKGRLEPIVGWNMGLRCPFETNNELGLNYANSIVKILQITVIEYIKGSCKNLIDEMTRWNNSRLDNNDNISGHALRVRQFASDVRENDGTVYAKLTRVYHLPPLGMMWNSGYWGGL
jgi:hypothetical protein